LWLYCNAIGYDGMVTCYGGGATVSGLVVVEGAKPRGRPKRLWKAVVEGDVKTLKMNKKEAFLCSKGRKVISGIKMVVMIVRAVLENDRIER